MSEIVNILLVDDDDVDAEMVHRGLVQRKISNPIIRARDGLEALARLRAEDGHEPLEGPVIILLDLNMPRMDEFEFLEAIRQDENLRRSIIFVLTTSDEDHDKISAYEKNVAGYLVKSDVGNIYEGLFEVLQDYWKYVEFPPETDRVSTLSEEKS